MALEELIKEARKDHNFVQKFDYWIVTRKKSPDLDWLMNLLEETLGYDYVQEAAEAYILEMKEAVAKADNTKE